MLVILATLTRDSRQATTKVITASSITIVTTTTAGAGAVAVAIMEAMAVVATRTSKARTTSTSKGITPMERPVSKAPETTLMMARLKTLKIV
jgi:hypothetical protein